MAIVGNNAILNQFVPTFRVKDVVDGQILEYDSTRKAFVNVNNSGGSGGASLLGELENVADSVDEILTLENGQGLVYDSTTELWTNTFIDFDTLINQPTNASYNFTGLADVLASPIPNAYLMWNPDGSQVVYADTIPAENIDGIFGIAQGGTGVASFTDNQILIGNGTDPIELSALLTFDSDTSTLTVGSGAIIGAGNGDLTISTTTIDTNINLLPFGTGSVVIGPGGSGGLISSEASMPLELNAGSALLLLALDGDIFLELAEGDSRKIRVNGPTPEDYATGLQDGDIPNKYYVDEAIASGGGSTSLSDLTDTTGPHLLNINHQQIWLSTEGTITSGVPFLGLKESTAPAIISGTSHLLQIGVTGVGEIPTGNELSPLLVTVGAGADPDRYCYFEVDSFGGITSYGQNISTSIIQGTGFDSTFVRGQVMISGQENQGFDTNGRGFNEFAGYLSIAAGSAGEDVDGFLSYVSGGGAILSGDNLRVTGASDNDYNAYSGNLNLLPTAINFDGPNVLYIQGGEVALTCGEISRFTQSSLGGSRLDLSTGQIYFNETTSIGGFILRGTNGNVASTESIAGGRSEIRGSFWTQDSLDLNGFSLGGPVTVTSAQKIFIASSYGIVFGLTSEPNDLDLESNPIAKEQIQLQDTVYNIPYAITNAVKTAINEGDSIAIQSKTQEMLLNGIGDEILSIPTGQSGKFVPIIPPWSTWLMKVSVVSRYDDAMIYAADSSLVITRNGSGSTGILSNIPTVNVLADTYTVPLTMNFTISAASEVEINLTGFDSEPERAGTKVSASISITQVTNHTINYQQG